jgi:hypothetical protein
MAISRYSVAAVARCSWACSGRPARRWIWPRPRVERMRFDRQRAIVLQSLTAAQERLHAHLMELERHTETVPLTRDRHASSVP